MHIGDSKALPGHCTVVACTASRRGDVNVSCVQSSREELLEDIEELKKKISGAVEES